MRAKARMRFSTGAGRSSCTARPTSRSTRMEVDKSVGVITGGASGLGEGLVRMLVTGGARAVVLDLPSSKGAEMVAEVGEDKVQFVEVDVAEPDQVERAMA